MNTKMLSSLALIGGIAAIGGGLLRKVSPLRKLGREARKRSHVEEFIQHHHDAVVHEHEHPHVTHNRREGMDEFMGEWEHLTATHKHEHNHPAITHAHAPHENAEHEHLGEEHIHDHEHPTRS